MAELAHGGKGENVGQGVGVVPHCAKVLDVTDEQQDLRAAVGVNFQLVAAASNLGEETWVFETWVFEHQYGGLAVKKQPGRGDEFVAVSQVGKS